MTQGHPDRVLSKRSRRGRKQRLQQKMVGAKKKALYGFKPVNKTKVKRMAEQLKQQPESKRGMGKIDMSAVKDALG